MDFNNGLGLLATILGIVGLAGGAAGYFKASRGDSIIKYQAIEIDGLRRTKADLEKELVTKDAAVKTAEAACVAKDETIVEQGKQIKFLQKMGQGSPQLKKLTIAVENQTKLISKMIEKENKK
jgi:hypothetical protein